MGCRHKTPSCGDAARGKQQQTRPHRHRETAGCIGKTPLQHCGKAAEERDRAEGEGASNRGRGPAALPKHLHDAFHLQRDLYIHMHTCRCTIRYDTCSDTFLCVFAYICVCLCVCVCVCVCVCECVFVCVSVCMHVGTNTQHMQGEAERARPCRRRARPSTL